MIFKSIAVIPNEKKDPDFERTKNLIEYLLKIGESGINIFVNEIYQQKINNCMLKYRIKYANEEDLYKSCDLLVALGGDATMLRTAAKASRLRKPVIGVNLGRIGFMSEIELDEIHLFERVFAGDFKIENRMMIDAEIIKNAKGAGEAQIIQNIGSALNDAVITNGVMAKLIEMDLFCDGVKITHYRADGVIIAPPTGSTAYSMSAGGPFIDPNIECLCVTPICPYSLSGRPIIFSHDSVLELRTASDEVYLTVDGQINVKLSEGDVVRVKKSQFAAKLLSVKNHGFFDVIRAKISEN